MARRFFTIAGILSCVSLLAIWGCTGSHSGDSTDSSGGTTPVLIVGPSPTSSTTGTGTTTGSTGGTSTSAGPRPTTGTQSTSSSTGTTGSTTNGTSGTSATGTTGTTGGPTTGYTTSTTGIGPTAGTTTTSGTTGTGTTGTNTNGTGTTGTSTTATSTTGGNNLTQIPVVDSQGAFPYAFTTPVTAASGSTVDWQNQTSVQHGITWDNQSPSSSPGPGANIPIFNAGTTSATWQVPTVATQTTYNYHCTVHGTAMSGQIIVTP